MTTQPNSPRLHETGEIVITQTAARQYADWTRLPIGDAARELAENIHEARRQMPDAQNGLERWRHRSLETRMDILVQVSREGGRAVVVHCHVRSRQKARHRSE